MTKEEIPSSAPAAGTSTAGPPQRGTLPRRRALQLGAAATTAAGVAATLPSHAQAQSAGQAPDKDGHKIFQHGVASGDPYANSVLLWTRVTSHPDDYAGRNRGTNTTVRWDIAKDADFRQVVASGEVTATPATDMTVKPEAGGLQPYTEYFYRFTVVDGAYAGQVSPVARTKTAPASGQMVPDLRLALFSCSNWEAGYFSAYRDMSQRGDIDAALCVGDYIYEYKQGEYTGKTGAVRDHLPANEIQTLQDYRERYAQYHTDADLQAAHAACPWIVTWDDHESANDSWSGGAQNHDPETEGDWTTRRNAAMQAYLEWLPIRATAMSEGGHLYRSISFGQLAELNMLDLRTYRNQPTPGVRISEVDNPDRSIMGSEQFGWLAGRLETSQAQWNLIGNSVMISPILIPPLDPKSTEAVTQLLGLPENGIPYNMDQWDGFTAERHRLLSLLRDKGINNAVFLTGDIHSSWACDVPVVAGEYPASGATAVEIVCTSVTSSNIDDILKLPENNPLSLAVETAFTGLNRHVKYLNFDAHGYNVVQITPEYIHSDFLHLSPDAKLAPNAPLHRAMSARTYRGQGIRMHNAGIDPATKA